MSENQTPDQADKPIEQFIANKASMPIYESHKRVCALQIERVDEEEMILHFKDPRFAPKTLMPETYGHMIAGALRGGHTTLANGYLVIYEDGYSSWSPREVFESGYEPWSDQLAPGFEVDAGEEAPLA